jgi:hypothetical protein
MQKKREGNVGAKSIHTFKDKSMFIHWNKIWLKRD